MQFLTKNYSNFTKVKICGEGMWNAAIRRWKELLVCQVNNLSEPCFPLTTFPPNPTNREKPQKTTRSIPIGRWMSSIEFICNGIHVPLGLWTLSLWKQISDALHLIRPSLFKFSSYVFNKAIHWTSTNPRFCSGWGFCLVRFFCLHYRVSSKRFSLPLMPSDRLYLTHTSSVPDSKNIMAAFIAKQIL